MNLAWLFEFRADRASVAVQISFASISCMGILTVEQFLFSLAIAVFVLMIASLIFTVPMFLLAVDR